MYQWSSNHISLELLFMCYLLARFTSIPLQMQLALLLHVHTDVLNKIIFSIV